MKRLLTLLLPCLLTGCISFSDKNPYEESLRTLSVRAVYPEGYEKYTRSGVQITAENKATGATYALYTDDAGCVSFRLPHALYRLSLSDKADSRSIFNGTLMEVRHTGGDLQVDMPVVYSRAGNIVFKELYFSGCSKAPESGSTTNDQYVILHNNGTMTEYLDGLCFGSLNPMTSAAPNKWIITLPSGETVFQEFAPIDNCVWQFKGSGNDFPLEPGQDAVLAIRGARDFAAEFPLSVNLNKAQYFVCHSREHFPQTNLHFDPGDQILPSHILNAIKKTGSSTAYLLAVNSPTALLFRPEADFDLKAYMEDDTRCIATIPGGTTVCTKIPWEWVYDGVEIFFGATNNKRIPQSIDAGGFKFSTMNQGRTVHRKLDAEATAEAGYNIYVDTNNSSNDFEERETQSLHGQ